MTARRVVVGLVIWLAVGWRTVGAQPQRPLETQDPAPIGSGRIRIETGLIYLEDQRFPVSGLRGRYVNAPRVGISIGLGAVAEIQIDHVSLQWLRVTDRRPPRGPRRPTFTGGVTRDVDDLVIGAKTRLIAEGARRPSLGFRFATRLPNAGTESGLGLDTMDFESAILAAKSLGPVRLIGNLGLAILGDPTSVARQNDVVRYGMALVASVSERVRVVTEVHGRHNTRSRSVPPGTNSSAFARGGVRLGRGAVTLDGALVVGLHRDDASVGMTVGVTWMGTGLGPT